jgi:hypothetical protein
MRFKIGKSARPLKSLKTKKSSWAGHPFPHARTSSYHMI